MTLLEEYTRVSRQHPCPVCGKRDWCLVRLGAGGQVISVLCPRTPSDRRWGNAGYVHDIDGGQPAPARRSRRICITPRRSFGKLARHLADAVDPGELHAFAQKLGVSTESLTRLGIGHAGVDVLRDLEIRFARSAWCFPMYDHVGKVIGIRLRLPGGRKLSVKGSRCALFVPTDVDGDGPLLVAEGESDTAALLTLGARAIGRPGALTCMDATATYVERHREARVVLVSDADDVGREGAVSLSRTLRERGIASVIIEPPAADVRAWLNAGATGVALQALVAAGSADGEVRCA